ncbi:MAG TPA: SRPBCC domain-containing protein [Chloroflexota bacterium]|nr:SRPBCC domain-containing protein [Chloroflexota bacterium]
MTDSGFTSSSAAAPSTLDADFAATMSFKSPADTVFEALTTPAGLARWWAPVSGSGLTGGELTFVFGDHPVLLRVDQAERPSVVRWTVLASAPLPDWVGTTISFDVSPLETGGSRLHFRHTGLTPRLECFDMCREGWEQYLPSLVDYVDSGQGNPFGSAGDTRAARLQTRQAALDVARS